MGGVYVTLELNNGKGRGEKIPRIRHEKIELSPTVIPEQGGR